MKQENKMELTASAMAEAQKAYSASVEEFLDPSKQGANVVGMGVGVKWKKGQPTGEPALVVLVTNKLEKSQVRSADLIPSKLAEMQTDVLAIGYPFAGESESMEVGAQTLGDRVRAKTAELLAADREPVVDAQAVADLAALVEQARGRMAAGV